MGQEMESDVEKLSASDLSPNTVLPYPRHLNLDKANAGVKLGNRNAKLRVKDGFTEISFRRYRSASCKHVRSRLVGLEGNIELKRGSVYQSSREVRQLTKMGSNEGRRKIELLRSSDTSSSFSIVDSLCSSDEENAAKRSPFMSLNSNINLPSVENPCLKTRSSDDFIEIFPNLDKREKEPAGILDGASIGNQNQRYKGAIPTADGGNHFIVKDRAHALNKSLSAKLEIPLSPAPSDSDCSTKSSSKTQFSHLRKMLDPFTKSKSLRSPSDHVAEACGVKSPGTTNMARNETVRKSLFHDFSHTDQNSGFDSHLISKENSHSAGASSPVHLHGCLKLENKNGVPSFEFSLSSPEELIVARTWKANNTFNWVYTFHSICNRKKSSASGWGSSDANKESSLVGQMQVSSYLCSELNDGRIFDDSMVTEFVLYDIAHARQSASTPNSPDRVLPPDKSARLISKNRGLNDDRDRKRLNDQPRHAFDKDKSDYSICHPLPSAVLHPGLEHAAIVIQLPFVNRESLKYKSTGKDKKLTNVLSVADKLGKKYPDIESAEKVKVAVPTGNHSLPNGESGPLSLLDRWKLGGGCDCGGWDMACPLTVLSNSVVQCFNDTSVSDKWKNLELFVQGSKETIPALTMRTVEEGKFAVDFHAQLSTLQAFSICVAMLHSAEASLAAQEESTKQLPHSNSLKVLLEEEAKDLIATVREENNKVSLKATTNQQSYVVNPPFSPIARV